jgi:uncharacterized membrane protein YfcA
MLDSLSTAQIVFSFAVLAVAYVVRGIAGFGSGLIAIPLLALHLPLPAVVPTIVALDYAASASQGLSNRQAIAWRDIWPLLPFTLIGVGLALWLFNSLDTRVLLKLLAVFIILFAVYSLLVKRVARNPSRLWAVPAGGLGGLIGTLFGTGGPFYAIYLQLCGHEKHEFRATFATIFLLDGANRLVGYLATGFFSLDTLLLTAVAMPVMIVSLYLGGHIHTNISPETFKRGISALLVVSGVMLLLK